jgi:DNA repair exonuclease SbcCD ATPase subunit
MDREEQAKRLCALKKRVSELSAEELIQRFNRLNHEIESRRADTPALELVPTTQEEREALPDDVLEAQIDLLEEQSEFEERLRELDQRAIKLGLLKLADQAPRCSHLKSNGQPCRAPAMGNRLFCVFHGRALETQDGPGMNVKILEDRQSLQLTVKQIMEQIVQGRIEPQKASLLLRAVQIANSTLRPKRVRAARPKRKSTQSEADEIWGNPKEDSA